MSLSIPTSNRDQTFSGSIGSVNTRGCIRRDILFIARSRQGRVATRRPDRLFLLCPSAPWLRRRLAAPWWQPQRSLRTGPGGHTLLNAGLLNIWLRSGWLGRRALLLRLTRSRRQSGLWWGGFRPLQLLPLPVGRARLRRRWRLTRPVLQLLLSGTVLLAGLLLLQPGQFCKPGGCPVRFCPGNPFCPDRRGALPRLTPGLARRKARCWSTTAAAEILRRVNLTHEALVALHLLRRNRQRHGGETRAADAGADREAAGALRQEAKPRARAVIDFDPSDLAVGVGIKLDRDILPDCWRRRLPALRRGRWCRECRASRSAS